mgnify:CR=1 FL=1
MKCLFDTSVLVPAVVDQLANHEAAFSCFRGAKSDGGRAFGSCHVLAEAYATLTALPLPRRITALEESHLVRSNFAKRLELVSLSPDDYAEALEMTAGRGLISGQIYDALHIVAALKSGCWRIYTYNIRHFGKLVPSDMEITTP